MAASAEDFKNNSLINYDKKLTPPAFGFQNLGATCYFNALLQALLSCTSLTQVMLNNKDKEEYQNNPVSKVYIEMLVAMLNKKTIDQMPGMAPKLWKTVFTYAGKRKDKVRFTSGQQDANEGFHLFMDAIEDLDEVQQLFEHRYESRIRCQECKKWVSIKRSENNVFSVEPNLRCETLGELKDFGMIQSRNLSEFLACQLSCVDKDHECPECHVRKERTRLDRITMVPEILVVLSKKYNSRGQKLNVVTDFPSVLTFEGINGKLKYGAVAQVEHSGSMGGGHYWAVCRRKLGWICLNDMGVSKDTFKPTVNTYIVFYHKIP